jgi:hypothetical protein
MLHPELDCNNLKIKKIEGKKIRVRVRWRLKGDMVSKEFFQAVKERSTSTTIMSLKNKDGIEVKDRAGLEAVCMEYYRELYSSPPQDPASATAAGSFLDSMLDKLTRSTKQTLAWPLSEQELLQAAKEMATWKSPSPDGYAIEYYTRM